MANHTPQEILAQMKGSVTQMSAHDVPGFIPSKKAAMNKVRVRYGKFNLDDLADVAELERIETKNLRGEGIFISAKKDFFFMDKIFMLVTYVEEFD